MAELYAKPFETIETGYNPQQSQNGGQGSEMESYLSSLPPEERQAAIERINAPLSGEELASMASSGQRMPTLQEYAEIEKWHKTQEISFFDGLGKIAEGGEQVMTDLSKAFGAIFDKPADVASKMPATAVEAFSQGTRNFYGMLSQSQNTDSALFRVKDFLNGTGTIEDRYNQYISALKFNKDSAELAEGKQTLVMDKDMINHEVTQAMAYIADPTLFIPFGKVASTGLRAVGLGERLALAGAKSAAIKNGIIGNTIKWGVGQPLEFLGGAVRNTIDFGLDKAGAAFEATTGVGAKEFAQTARMSGIGFSASAVAGYAVPYASTLSDAYLAGSSAKGFGEALTLMGETMSKNKFGRGINSWAAEALEQAKKNGVKLSPHAEGLLNAINAVDPLFAYGWNAVEASAHGAVIGAGLGYASGGEEGMYHGIGAGIALGAVGGTAGKVVADLTGGTNVARRVVQAKMVIEGHKVTNPEKAMFFQAMQTAAEARGQDVDLVNGIIAGIDKVAPNFEFHAMTPDQFAVEALKKGYNPYTGKFMELSAIDHEFGGDRRSKSKAMYILRSIGGDFVGNSKGFLDALKRASAKDSANPNKPAGNISSNLRKYTDVAKTFDKLTKTQQDAILKEIDGQADIAKELGGNTKLRDHYDALTWSEAWTDSLVKKFESDREGARKDIIDMLAQETDKNGKLNRKGRALTDKLRNEGFLDREGKLLRERNLLQADMTLMEFASVKGGVMRRESDGKTHMYINLNKMGSETFPHELFHTIMRESPMKDHFTKSLIGKLIGSFDDKGNLVRTGEVNINQVRKFFKKYIDLTSYNEDGTLNPDKSVETMKLVDEALAEFESAGNNKKISDKSRGLLEHYTEEFGAYYFSHWLMGRNRNTLFFGGELKGIEGLVERTKDSFKDFWQSKISKANPEFDFSEGLNASFDRSKGLGRISSIDYYMRDMVRAASNANRDAFNPDAMSADNLKDFERSNGLRNLTAQDSNRRLNPREQVTQNIRLGKEAHKILTGLDKNLRTSQDTVDENGKPVITGRLSENELDALVKGGIVPRAWADKVNQGYAMLDGTVSNVFSAGYLGKTEQTTDASYPRLTGKDVSFKNRKAVLFDVETKIKADGTFYTLFHTLDLAVIEQRGNHLWQNTDYKNLWNGDRSAMEADFFRYISNASKASTDNTKLDSAALLEKGDGFGAQRRDVLQQMAGMALQTGDAYKHQPIAVIPEGIRHSVTTFNIDGMTTPRVEQGARYDIDMKNAHKFIRENWQPDDMRQEKTPVGRVLTHESGFKFTVDNSGVSVYSDRNAKIGKYNTIKEATTAGKNFFNSVHSKFDDYKKIAEKQQNSERKNFQILEPHERQAAIDSGDVFSLQKVKDFVGSRRLIRQTKEEFTIDRFEKDIKQNPEKLFDIFHNELRESLNNLQKQKAINEQISKLEEQLANGIHVDDEVFVNQELFKLRQESQDVEKLIKNKFVTRRFYNLLEDFGKQQEMNGKQPTPVDVFINQNKIDLAAQGVSINEFVMNLNDTLNYLKKGNVQRDGDVDFVNGIYGKTYNQNFQTGVPFVTLGTHGTKYIEMMFAREILAEKLGSRYSIESSQSGGFYSGGQHTSLQYAEIPPANAKEALQRMAFPKTAKDAIEVSPALMAEWNSLRYSEMPSLVEDLLTVYFNGKDADGYYTGITGNKVTESTLTKIILKDVLGFSDTISSVPFAERLNILKGIIEGSVFDPDKGSPLLNVKNAGVNTFHEYAEKVKNNPNNYHPDFLREAFLRNLSKRLISDASDRALYSNYKTGILGELGWKITNRGGGASSSKSVSTAIAVAEGYDSVVFLRNKYGHNKDLQSGNSYYNKLVDWKSEHYYDLIEEIGSIETKIGVPMPIRDTPMQTRSLFRMDNPLVIEGRKEYKEYYLKDKIRPAIAAGHDGIVFREMRDGGNFDNIYIVFKDGLKDNQLGIDTSFDDVSVPRGNDETGEKVRYGKDLGLAFQPDDIDAPKQVQGIKMDMIKAYDVFRQEYEESTGQSWTQDKFMQRAKNWQFFGDENGFVAVRPQRSGFVKLVGMAGNNKSKLRGIQQIQQQGLPIWGMVSKDIKDMAVKRGMREPNMIERTLLKQALNSAALGDAEILGYTSDNGVRLRYPDVGEVVKYMVGSPEYYQKLRSDFGDQIKSKIGFQPDEASQGGRIYNENSKEFKTGFIGKWAENNKDLLKGFNIEFIDRGGIGGYRNPDAQNVRIRLQDNSVKGKTVDVGHITAQINHKGRNGNATATLSTRLDENYRGKKLSYALYSEMAERLRSMGVKWVDGMIVNQDGIPIKVREKIIGDTRMIGADGSYAKARPISQEKGRRIIQRKQARGGEWEGINVVNELDFNARYQPSEGDAIGKAQYEIDQQIVDRLKKSFKFPEKLLTVKDMLQFIIDNDGHMSPLAKEMIGSLDEHGLGALIKQQTTTFGSSQKGIKGGTYHSFHPAHNSAFMVLERNLERRKKYSNASYEYLMMEEMLHSLTISKSPEPLKHGSTIEDTLKNVQHFLRNKEKYEEHYDPAWKKIHGYSEEWWTIADAYQKVHDQFATGKYLDGSEITKSEKNTIAYRLSNIGEFIVGITQTKEVQKILSQIKVPKKETGLLSNVFNAIKRIWGFGDETMGSLLEHTSDAMEKVIKRPKNQMEQYDTGRFSEKSKQYFDGMPKFQPAEGGRTYTPEQFNKEFIGKQASENKDLTNGIRLSYRGWDKADGKDEGRKVIMLTRSSDGAEIGRIDFDYSSLTKHGLKSRGFSENENGGIVIDGINVKVNERFQGMGYQHILYSEMFERARATGAVGFSQSIENKKGLPLKSVNRVIGEADNFIASLSETNAQKPTQENFDRLMANAPSPTGNWMSNEPAVQNWGNIKKNAWYMPAEGDKIGNNSSNVKLLLEGMASGRILRTSSYKGLGLEDANLIAHTPDTAKIGQVTAGDKALADLQGGIFYAIANGKKIWASNFAGEGETNILVQFANDQLKSNPNKKTYILLVKPSSGDNSKIFASVDGARGVSNIFKHLNDSKVMTDLRYVDALKNSAEMHLGIKGLEGLGKEELYARIDDALFNSKANKIGFEHRRDFTREIARQLKESGAFDSKKSKDALVKSFHKGFEGGFSIVEMERVFGNLMAEDIIKDVPAGHVYGALEISSPLRETPDSGHRGYDASIEQESGDPARLIMFDRTAHVTEIVNKKSGKEIAIYKAGEGSYHSHTGGQIPYQEVKGKSKMPFQPAEGWRDWQSERTSVGSVIKNTAGYVIMVQRDKFKVYNPYKAMIGIYDNEEQAKRRVQKDEPKR